MLLIPKQFYLWPLLFIGMGTIEAQDLITSDAMLLERIEVNLEELDIRKLDTIVFNQVQEYCKNDDDCLYRNYSTVSRKIEEANAFWSAIPIVKEMIKLAQQQKDLYRESEATERLIRLYNYIDEIEEIASKYQDLIKLYERIGNVDKIIHTKFMIEEDKVWRLNEITSTLPKLESLIQQAIDLKLDNTVNRLYIRLKYIYEEFGYNDKLARVVQALEKIPLSNPIKPQEVRYALHANSGRADIFLLEDQYEKAAIFYQKALKVVRDKKPVYSWDEIYILHRIAKLEWKRQNNLIAKAYLDTGYTTAKDNKFYDHLIVNLETKIKIAEEENRFSDALQFTREIYATEAIRDSISEGFDLKRHFLQLTTEQLTAEKEKQALNLRLKENQLQNAVIIICLALIIATGLFFNLRKQRRDKQVLDAQNVLILQQSEKLKNLDSAKSRFFANVSHELRTPLTLILNPIQSLLKENNLTPKQARLLQMASQSGHQLKQLINKILDLRKLELHKMELNKQWTPLSAYFSRHLALFESLALKQGINFRFNILINEEIQGEIDKEKCRQILYNLLSNAFKFTPENGKVTTTISLKNEVLYLTVTDNGCGIHADDVPYIFDRYFQTSRQEKNIAGGTGIGLALCQEYIHLFDGKIEVESTFGKNTTFKLTFPVKVVENNQLTVTNNQETDHLLFPSPLSTIEINENEKQPSTILVVEDNSELSKYLQLLLSDKYKVITAQNGQKAWDYLFPSGNLQKANNCQLILSDLMMPIMDGYQLLEKLKSNDATRHIPVIMLTARAEVKDKLKALRIGVDDYLVKPFEEEELMLRIENLLLNQMARNELGVAELKLAKSAPKISQEDQKWLADFEAFVQKNISNDFLSIPFLAREFTMSESTLLRKMKHLVGLTPVKYLQDVRLEKGRQLIENRTYNSISRVAYQIGYGDANSFSRAFKRRYGKLPSLV